jgi:amino acid transporter
MTMREGLGPGYTDADKKEDVKVLHSMGYAQELDRRMGRFSNFAISFSIICILSGGINSLAQGTSGAGGAAIGLGWPLGCAISGVFALALAQIGSAYPTAGGLYHWGSILGNRFTGWLTAWLNLLGLITVLGAINVGTWTFFEGAFPFLGIENNLLNETIFMIIITGGMALINHLGIRLTALLTDFSGYLIFATAVVLALVALIAAEHWDVTRLWSFTNYSGDPGGGVWPPVSNTWVFLLGLLLPIYTPSLATTPRLTPPRKLKGQRTRCRTASSIRCGGRRYLAGSCCVRSS